MGHPTMQENDTAKLTPTSIIVEYTRNIIADGFSDKESVCLLFIINDMEEFRIDCLYQTEEELVVTKELRQNIFRLNHTMPDTEEYRELLHKVFPHLGENCRIETPFSGVRTANVKFGRNVIVMPGCLMISAGGITIGENAVVGAGSVVMHDVEPNTLVAGNPAKFIRKIKP